MLKLRLISFSTCHYTKLVSLFLFFQVSFRLWRFLSVSGEELCDTETNCCRLELSKIDAGHFSLEIWKVLFSDFINLSFFFLPLGHGNSENLHCWHVTYNLQAGYYKFTGHLWLSAPHPRKENTRKQSFWHTWTTEAVLCSIVAPQPANVTFSNVVIHKNLTTLH